jgi:hypothetical protein
MSRQDETLFIVEPMIRLFRERGFVCQNIIADATLKGLADYFIYSEKLKIHRFIEFKHFKGNGTYTKLTDAQKKLFPIQFKAGVPLYVIADWDLTGEANYHKRLAHYKRVVEGRPNIEDLLDKSRRNYLPV